MRSRATLSYVLFAVLAAACSRNQPTGSASNEAVIPAGGDGQETIPRAEPRGDAPLETAPPNVPELEPAFEGQTRARAIKTETAIEVTEIADGLDHPWAIAFLPDGRMLVTEKIEGRLRIVDGRGRISSPLRGVPEVDGRDQGGLLDIEIAPDFERSRRVFFSYYEPREGGNGLAVARARLSNGARPRLENVQVIFRQEPTHDSTKHAGGRLAFGPEGMLFVTLGDRFDEDVREKSQRLDNHFGKVVRIRLDGSAPPDNPFVDREGARPEVWSIGHRNVLGIAFDARDRLWVVEMGPQGGDELNLVQKGRDYGWPTIGFGREYSGDPIHETAQAEGMEQPIYFWDPVISPGALTIYSGDVFPEWKGDFLIAGLTSKAIVRLRLENDRVVGEERVLAERGERIREVVQGPDGSVYALTDGADGKLLRLTPREGN